ncbi:hypothetical protein [Microcoleus sp. S36b_A4]|uniref:hypothetical protein n=1 Tax=Microcoleus sp. S36b_A4 TaxID=3055420 RepID=UPI002FD44920
MPEFEEPLTAARQVIKFSIVVPEAIDKPENWRSFLKAPSASSKIFNAPRNN